MSTPKVKVVFGGAAISEWATFNDEAHILPLYDLLEKNGVKNIDTGLMYGASETNIGATGGAQRFIIDTKTPGGLRPGTSTSTGILEHIKESLEKLKTDKVYFTWAI
jgi:aryl-alcohol dehydrogenase-like predicted oxidoreductase